MQQESKRQKQVAGLLMEELNDIFRRLGLNMYEGGMVSISSVKVTPDLFQVRVYLSLFKVNDPAAYMKKLEERAWEIKKELSQRVRHQLRSMPELTYYLDDTLEHVDKIDAIFRKIDEERKQFGSSDNTNPEA
ncbi:30S ribosome-binding factor RbfA [Parasegetibacter sp. NRK P23]|uniref:30S ribosome-binding factor RbfA n=1 Tax=Parasegetibacter sp. NRK P23 TaxID=2942999 RepID=UPI0020436BD1|nr:30S ribosome-binding factor RbfA [Parasegetibacter sp. NRK P23]MCM5530203.1 30S ribosome-binding factor RbfA [Parasegetibacter sp. NRK P23]